MHELALVEGIISHVIDFAHERKGHVVSFKVAVGEFAQFDKRLIRELLVELVKGTELEKAKMIVEIERAETKCLYCNSKWGVNELLEPLSNDQKEMIHFLPELLNSFTKCPKCGKSDFEIEKGRSVRVAEVELNV
ncbi:MAG: hydrogenase/urease maturation nickel metallochaperone HypA [Nitrososphaerales archaeon]